MLEHCLMEVMPLKSRVSYVKRITIIGYTLWSWWCAKIPSVDIVQIATIHSQLKGEHDSWLFTIYIQRDFGFS